MTLEVARNRWKEETGDHLRSLFETGAYRYKSILTPRLHHHTRDWQQTDTVIAVNILNRFTALARPISIRTN